MLTYRIIDRKIANLYFYVLLSFQRFYLFTALYRFICIKPLSCNRVDVIKKTTLLLCLAYIQ